MHRVGLAYILWGFILAVISIVVGYFLHKDTLMYLATESKSGAGWNLLLLTWGILIAFFLISIGYIVVGKLFRVEKKQVLNKFGFILAIISLPIVPIGTAIGTYAMWVLCKVSKKQNEIS